MKIVTWDTCFYSSRICYPMSSWRHCAHQQTQLCLDDRREVSKCPVWFSARPGQKRPGLCSLPSGWAFPNALQQESRATLPSLTQCPATLESGPGTSSRPLPKAPQQSRSVLWEGLPATRRVGPVYGVRPHPLCLDSLGDALGHLFFVPSCLSGTVIVFALSVLALSCQCAVNFC